MLTFAQACRPRRSIPRPAFAAALLCSTAFCLPANTARAQLVSTNCTTVSSVVYDCTSNSTRQIEGSNLEIRLGSNSRVNDLSQDVGTTIAIRGNNNDLIARARIEAAFGRNDTSTLPFFATAVSWLGDDNRFELLSSSTVFASARNGSNGISANGSRNTINNYGVIGAFTNSNTNAIGVNFFGSSNTVNNYGTLRGESTGIFLNGVGGNNTVNNFGGTITSDGGLAIRGGIGNDFVYNAGVIAGGAGIAIDLDAGDDLFAMSLDSSLTGYVEGGTGTDTFALAGATDGTFNLGHIGTTFRSFERFEKLGSSAITITGNGVAGPWDVREGTLVLGTNLTGDVTVAAGAALGGSGTVGALTNAGLVSPGTGNGTSTLSASGNVIFGATSIYLVDVNAAGASDRIESGGFVLINAGSQLDVRAVSGSYSPGQRYEILRATTGVAGRFSSATTNLAFLSPELDYSQMNSVFLTFNRNGLLMEAAGRTPNQRAVGRGLDGLADQNAVKSAALGLTAAEAERAFDVLSGEAHATVQSQMLAHSEMLRGTLLSRMRGTGDNGAAALFNATPVAYSAASAGASAPVRSTDVEAWTQAFGSMGRATGDGNAAGVDRSTGGVLLGLEAGMGSAFRLGFAGSYATAAFDVDGRASSGSVDTGAVAVYGTGRFGNVALRAGAAHSRSDVDVTRATTFRGFSGATNASYAGQATQAFAEAGYALGLGAVALEPFTGVTYVNSRTGRFTESGSASALTGQGRDFDLVFSTAGLRVAAPVAMPAGALTLRGMLAWRHAFGDVAPMADVQFVAGGTPFAVAGTPVDRDSILMEAGFDWAVRRNVTVSLKYGGEIGSRDQEHALRGGVGVSF